MTVEVETATITLLDKFVEIEEECFADEAFTKRQIAYLLTDYNTIALVAKTNNNVVGFIIAQVEVEESIEYGHILTLNIAPHYRRQGFAKKLLSEIEKLLKEKGIYECHIEVREDNKPALKLYQTLGYRIIGKLERYYGRRHGLYLKKNLQIL